MKKNTHMLSKTILFTLVIFLGYSLFNKAEAQAVDPNIPLCEITRNLSVGDFGEDVHCLQRYLNHAGYIVAVTGPGSPGAETNYFGALTQSALIRWQNANALTVLSPLGLSTGTGFWGPSSFSRYVTYVRVGLGVF